MTAGRAAARGEGCNRQQLRGITDNASPAPAIGGESPTTLNLSRGWIVRCTEATYR
jgi:hypothetical protein